MAMVQDTERCMMDLAECSKAVIMPGIEGSEMRAAIDTIAGFIERGLMPDPEGLTVWDLGCGDGAFSAGLAALGANVIGSDLLLHRERLPAGVTFIEGGFDTVAAELGGSLDRIGLVFMHQMTEHVVGLKSFLADLFERLSPGVQLIAQHDNYFHPLGHHDHGFLRLEDETAVIVSRAVPCWADADCGRSEQHRAGLLGELPWQWSAASEATRDPADCGSCNYFRRARPWAHLLYGDDLVDTFPEDWFRTELNRMSPSQVLWDVQDAGFGILRAERTWVMNETPDELVRLHGRETLNALALTVRFAKPNVADRGERGHQ